jgi:hypothetical protein
LYGGNVNQSTLSLHRIRAKMKRNQEGKNNPMFGKPRPDLVLYNKSAEKRTRLSQVMRGSHNGMWKDGKITYSALHQWVNRNLSKSEACEICKRNRPLEACNVSGDYLRDLNDWQWLCRSCHMNTDGRIDNLRLPHEEHSEAAKKGWSKFSKQERHDRIAKGWIARRNRQ